jgi:hypothetical protein
MDALCMALLSFVASATGYSMPAECPQVKYVSQQKMERISGDSRIDAFTPFHGDEIYVNKKRYATYDRVKRRGILVHEFVHVGQKASGAYDGPLNCRKIRMAEREAYQIERLYVIASNGKPERTPKLRCGAPVE